MWSSHVAVFLITVLLVGCSNPEEKANKLFVEASQLVDSAQSVQKTSYSDAFKLYDDALANLEKIAEEYSSSQIAVKLTQSDTEIGPFAVSEFRGTIVPQARILAEAEEDPLKYAFLSARSFREDYRRYMAATAIALRHTNVGQIDRALEVLGIVEDPGFKDFVLIRVTEEYAEAHQFNLAIETAGLIKDESAMYRAFLEIAREYLQQGQRAKAIEVASQISEDFAEISDSSIDMAILLFEIGQEDKANVILSHGIQSQSNAVLRCTRFVDVARKCVKAGLMETAGERLLDAYKTAKKVEDRSAKQDMLMNIACTYAEADFFGKAMEVADGIEDDCRRDTAFAGVVREYAESGQFGQASELASRIANTCIKSRTLADMAAILSRKGDEKQALEVLHQALNYAKTCEDQSIAVDALVNVARIYADVRQMKKADEALSEALRIALARPQIIEEEKGKIAAAHAYIGQDTKANELLSDALGSIERTYDSHQRLRAMTRIVDWYVESNQYAKAFEISMRIENPYWRRQTASSIALECAESGGEIDSTIRRFLHEAIDDIEVTAAEIEANAIESAIKESIRREVPPRLAGYLIGGGRAIVDTVKIIRMGDPQTKGTSVFRIVRVYAKGSCVVLGQRESFEGQTTYRVWKDDSGNWVARHIGSWVD